MTTSPLMCFKYDRNIHSYASGMLVTKSVTARAVAIAISNRSRVAYVGAVIAVRYHASSVRAACPSSSSVIWYW